MSRPLNFILGIIAISTLLSSLSWALPRYAVQEGATCSSCHVNPSGAGKRNDDGAAFFMRDLPLKQSQSLVSDEFKSRLNKFIAFGADLRVQNLTTFASPKTNSSSVPQGSLYLEMNGGSHLLAYADFDLANSLSREFFAMARTEEDGHYIKLGKIHLPYGLRIQDGTSFIRTQFNGTFANADMGAELGMSPGPFQWVLAVSNGSPGAANDENWAKAITTRMEWMGQWAQLGTSFQWNKRTATDLVSTGIHGGLHFSPITLLGELDIQRNHPQVANTTSWVVASYGAVHWKVFDGLNLKTVYDFLDTDINANGGRQQRLAAGFDIYPLPFSKASLLYRYNIGTGAADDDQILLQLHVFF